MTSDIRDIFRKNLVREMDKAGITQRELAHLVGVSTSSMSDWVTGKKIPRMAKIEKLCSIFGVARMDLLDSPSTAQKVEGIRIPVLGSVVAGIPMEAIENVIGYEEISPTMAREGDYFALRVKGQSMEPVLSDGDTIIVRKQEDVESGEIAIVLVNGDEATVKRVKKSPEGITLIGDNAMVYQPHFYTNKEIETLPIRIIGKVIEQRRRF